jgi:hypothetical protein
MLCALSGVASAAVPVGSVVMYSDGRVEKLISHGNGGWLWEDDRKRQLVRSENPIVPLLRRTDFLSRKGYSQSVGEGDPDSIKQLPSGTRVGFTVVRTRHTGERSTRNWDCKHLGKRQEKVLGVMRELDSFACERFVIQRKTWQKQFRESRQFSYSRDLGLIVEMQRKTRKKSNNWKLVSIVPPDKVNYQHLSKKVRELRAAK